MLVYPIRMHDIKELFFEKLSPKCFVVEDDAGGERLVCVIAYRRGRKIVSKFYDYDPLTGEINVLEFETE